MAWPKGIPRGPQSPEHTEKIAAKKRGIPLSVDHRASIGAGLRGTIFSDERKARISAALKESESHQRRVAAGVHRTHGSAARNSAGTRYTVEYRAWLAMRQRTLNPRNPNYPFYGGRGIGVCDRWNPKKGGTFQMFLDDMGLRPEWATGGLDRIDPSGDYVPSNCRWASKSMQIRNRRCSGCVSSEALLLLLLAERAQWVRS